MAAFEKEDRGRIGRATVIAWAGVSYKFYITGFR